MKKIFRNGIRCHVDQHDHLHCVSGPAKRFPSDHVEWWVHGRILLQASPDGSKSWFLSDGIRVMTEDPGQPVIQKDSLRAIRNFWKSIQENT